MNFMLAHGTTQPCAVRFAAVAGAASAVAAASKQRDSGEGWHSLVRAL